MPRLTVDRQCSTDHDMSSSMKYPSSTKRACLRGNGQTGREIDEPTTDHKKIQGEMDGYNPNASDVLVMLYLGFLSSF